MIETATRKVSVESPRITVGSFVRGLWGMVRLALSLVTTCEHRNTSFPGYYQQKCWDCKRVRTVGIQDGPGLWHLEVL